jgi:hypothetical protein
LCRLRSSIDRGLDLTPRSHAVLFGLQKPHVFIQSASDYFGFGLPCLPSYLPQCPLLVGLNVDLFANHSHT